MPTGEFKAKRILIVEDEILLAMNLEDMLIELGHNVIAVATRMSDAISLAADGDIDLAILDLNLSGALSFPVAQVLRARGVPFLFATGYGSHGLTEDYRSELVLAKPYGIGELKSVLAKVAAVTATG